MAEFTDTLLDLGYLYETKGGPGFLTVVVETDSAEVRVSRRSMPIHAWELGEQEITLAAHNTLLACWWAVGGMGKGFRYKDWNDFEVTLQTPATLTSTTFQIQKVYAFGGESRTRTIKKIAATTLKVYVGGVLKAEGADYTANYNTGVITFESAPGGAVTVTCEFHVPVRFDQDDWPDTFIAASTNPIVERLYRIGSLRIREIAA